MNEKCPECGADEIEVDQAYHNRHIGEISIVFGCGSKIYAGGYFAVSFSCIWDQLVQVKAENVKLAAQNQWLKSSISNALISQDINGITRSMAIIEKLYMMQDAAVAKEK